MATTAERVIAGLPIQKVSEREDLVKVLLYGVPGVGKTFLAGTADDVPDMKPVLFIDIEGGTKTIREVHPDIDVVRVKDIFDEKGKLSKTAWEKISDVYEELRRGVLHYRTIVVDSLTEAQKVSMYSVMKRTVEGDPQRDVDIPAQRDWGKSGEMVRRMVRAFRDLDCHVIFTALEAQVKDGATGAISVTPSLPGKLAFEVSAFLDIVLYMYAKPEGEDRQVVRRVLSQPTGKQVAKDRSGKLPIVLESPTMASIAELVLDRKG